ncbi:MAG: hypothetical protein QM691_15795 [Opitutaceae bacterium]
MKRVLLVAVLLGAPMLSRADPPPPPRSINEIRQEMTAIRRGTDWGDAEQAKSANERLAALTEEMMRAARQHRPEQQAANAASAAAAANNTADPNEDGLDIAKLNQELVTQAAAGVAGGKGADLDLAKPARERIAVKYAADVDLAIRCPDIFTAQTVLVIDFSSPAAEAIVGQMENFRGITTLVLTGGRTGASVDLSAVLQKAKGYPLRELHIVGFRTHVTVLPPEVVAFPNLERLAVFNNSLTALPTGIGGLRKLTSLSVDLNPLPTVLSAVRPLAGLKQLGLAHTDVGTTELAELRRLLPGCEIQIP